MSGEKQLRHEDLASALKEGLSHADARTRAAEEALVRAVQPFFGGYGDRANSSVQNFETIREMWDGTQSSLEYLVRRAADNPAFERAMGIKGLKMEVVRRDREPGLQKFLLSDIWAVPKIKKGRSLPERVEALRALNPALLGPYLDGVAFMTCDEVCARFFVHLACEKSGESEDEVWERVVQLLKRKPNFGWRQLARDVIKGQRVMKAVY